MKLALLRFLHLFMAVVVLLSSMGFGLVEHACQVRGKRVYSVYTKAEPGCGLCSVRATHNVPTTSVQATDCCQDSTRYNNVDTSSSLSQLLAKFIKAVTEPMGAGMTALFMALFDGFFAQLAARAVVGYESPPPLWGRALLTFVQAFLI
ncbi:hypothetical protein FAES_3822 [Fibrella aestuarina BUZ 2]|uniref:Uncharacterized protein n=1 Tax=Fibrella aestuarina BUZ 2 TaxID=1166018 RepID=I0KCH6_9BACT|nr:hypothetical protein [Fibrella aestuarina]CCH01829.1 hypothetical protein FAES_3822 [Fibrella aestuarina BUZ 2]